MRIEYNEYGKGYPYTIHGGWEDKVYCRLDDLKELKKEIKKILREEKLKKGIDKPTKQCYNKDKIKEREERKMKIYWDGYELNGNEYKCLILETKNNAIEIFRKKL